MLLQKWFCFLLYYRIVRGRCFKNGGPKEENEMARRKKRTVRKMRGGWFMFSVRVHTHLFFGCMYFWVHPSPEPPEDRIEVNSGSKRTRGNKKWQTGSSTLNSESHKKRTLRRTRQQYIYRGPINTATRCGIACNGATQCTVENVIISVEKKEGGGGERGVKKFAPSTFNQTWSQCGINSPIIYCDFNRIKDQSILACDIHFSVDIFRRDRKLDLKFIWLSINKIAVTFRARCLEKLFIQFWHPNVLNAPAASPNWFVVLLKKIFAVDLVRFSQVYLRYSSVTSLCHFF